MSRPDLDVAALYQRHRETLLSYFVRRTADTEVALDLWAETFAQALAGRKRYRGGTDEEAAGWLYGIARHQLAAYYRRGYAERRAMNRLGIERPAANALVDAELTRRAGLDELRAELATAMAALSAETRRAVELRIVQELPYPEVARQLSISETTARARVSRGLRALGANLNPDTLIEASRP